MLSDCIAIWRAGCIITSDGIADLLKPVVEAKDRDTQSETINILDDDTIAGEFTRTYGSLKRIVMKSTEWDAHVPAMSATLEWIKYCGGEVLPTQFMQVRRGFRGGCRFRRLMRMLWLLCRLSWTTLAPICMINGERTHRKHRRGSITSSGSRPRDNICAVGIDGDIELSMHDLIQASDGRC